MNIAISVLPEQAHQGYWSLIEPRFPVCGLYGLLASLRGLSSACRLNAPRPSPLALHLSPIRTILEMNFLFPLQSIVDVIPVCWMTHTHTHCLRASVGEDASPAWCCRHVSLSTIHSYGRHAPAAPRTVEVPPSQHSAITCSSKYNLLRYSAATTSHQYTQASTLTPKCLNNSGI